MTIRFLLILFSLHLLAAVTPSHAEEIRKAGVRTVGILMLTASEQDAIVKALREGLRELGYVEGRNIHVEFRTAQGNVDQLPALATQLAQAGAEVIVLTNMLTAQAVQRTAPTVPIVVALFDPLASGLVTNLAHPGGQVTGLTSMSADLYGKRLQLLKEALPSLKRVAVLWSPRMSWFTSKSVPTYIKMQDHLKALASTLSIDLSFVSVGTPEQFSEAFSAISKARARAVFVSENALFYIHRSKLAKLALQARLPTMYGPRVFAQEGGLMSYGVNWPGQLRRTARCVDKILKGDKPGDLPIEQPTEFELVINLKTARALGIAIPESLLARASEVLP